MRHAGDAFESYTFVRKWGKLYEQILKWTARNVPKKLVKMPKKLSKILREKNQQDTEKNQQNTEKTLKIPRNKSARYRKTLQNTEKAHQKALQNTEK